MSAPSFTSFPPSFSSFPDLEPGPSSRPNPPPPDKEENRKERKKHRKGDDKRTDGDRNERKHKRHQRGEHDGRRGPEHKSGSHSRRNDYGGSGDERRKLKEDIRQRADGVERPSAKEGLVYFTDRKGDPLNVQYGGLNSKDVPRYHLAGHGRKVLGLSPELSVVHRGREGLVVAPFGGRRMPLLTDARTRSQLAAPPTRRIVASSEGQYKYREIDGFLRICSNKPARDDQRYRDIESSKQGYDSDDSETSENYESLDDDSDVAPTTSLQSTLKELEGRLVEDPRHTPTWLSLLSHSLSTTPISAKNATKVRADITLAVLARAISAHPSNKRSKVLRLKYLKAGEEVWTPEKLREEWEDAVAVDDVEIWIAWLDWRLRRSSNMLRCVAEDTARALRAPALRGDEVGQVRVLWRVAVGLRDAGYVERANALFQAQAEWLYATPQRFLHLPLEDQLDALEEFWDSEALRIGESGATGWTAWDASGHREESVPKVAIPPLLDVHHSDPYFKWATAESQADHTRVLPLRTTDDEGADPYAVVLFSDIRPLLVPLRTQRAQDVFRRAWLSFIGLHIPGFLESLSRHPDDNTDDRWAYDYLVSSSYLNAIFPPPDTLTSRITADSQAGVMVGRQREYGSGFGPVKDWGNDAIAPFDALGSNKWQMWTSEDVQGVNVDLARGIFRQCRLSGSDTMWDILYLSFESAVNLKSALKASKSLLANARDSLPHWAAHARLEHLRGRLDDARKVYHTVLLADSSPGRAGEGAVWWDWTQMEWLAGNEDAAIQVILNSSRVSGSGGIAILRAKRHFESFLIQHPDSDTSWKERGSWIKVSALLELLTSSAQSALSVFDSHLDALEHRTPAHESLTVASLSMLYNHAMVLENPTPPALLRERAERAIEAYPNNTAVLGMFLEAEKGQGIWGRVRAMLGETTADGCGKEKSVTRRVAEVWVAGWEKGRWEAEVERTRSGLAAAVESDRTRGSATLWKLFIAFEVRAGQLERAKKLLFRAVGECPLVKDLYLLAFGPLREAFSTRELHQWADTMAEREIRMRVGLDEVVGEWTDNGSHGDRDGGASEGESGPASEDEIETRARELRRLMPY